MRQSNCFSHLSCFPTLRTIRSSETPQPGRRQVLSLWEYESIPFLPRIPFCFLLPIALRPSINFVGRSRLTVWGQVVMTNQQPVWGPLRDLPNFLSSVHDLELSNSQTAPELSTFLKSSVPMGGSSEITIWTMSRTLPMNSTDRSDFLSEEKEIQFEVRL